MLDISKHKILMPREEKMKTIFAVESFVHSVLKLSTSRYLENATTTNNGSAHFAKEFAFALDA